MASLSCCCCSCSKFSGVCGFPADTDLFILFKGAAGSKAAIVVFMAAGTGGAASVFMGADVEAAGLGASPMTRAPSSLSATFCSRAAGSAFLRPHQNGCFQHLTHVPIHLHRP